MSNKKANTLMIDLIRPSTKKMTDSKSSKTFFSNLKLTLAKVLNGFWLKQQQKFLLRWGPYAFKTVNNF
jgi:hypothetical protein